jgi:hypothetical protein
VSQSFGYIPKSGIGGSNGRSMFSFLSSLQIFFQSSPKVLNEMQILIHSLGMGVRFYTSTSFRDAADSCWPYITLRTNEKAE